MPSKDLEILAPTEEDRKYLNEQDYHEHLDLIAYVHAEDNRTIPIASDNWVDIGGRPTASSSISFF